MIVELPDGTELELPDSATPAQAQAAARKYLATTQKASGATQAAPVAGSPPPGRQAPVEGAGGAAFGIVPSSGKGRQYDDDKLEKIRLGLANSGIEAFLGAKQLFKDLSPEELQVLGLSREDVKNAGGWGTVGRAGGDIGMIAAGSLATPAKVASVLQKARAAAPIITPALQSGLTAAALTPVENQEDKYTEKLKEGGKAAAVQGALTGGGRLLKKAVTQAFKPSPDAVTLMDQGVYPTLQQGADSRVGQLIGGLASGSKAVPRRQAEEVLDAVTARATEGKVAMPGGTLNERLGVIKGVVDQDYDALLGQKKFPMTRAIREGAVGAAKGVQQPGGRFALEAREAEGIVRNVVGSSKNRTSMGHEKLAKDYLNALQQTITDGTPERVKAGIIAAKNHILQTSRNSQLSPDELALLERIDNRYFDLMRLKDAAQGAGGHESGVSIRRLADAYGRGPGMDRIGAQNLTDQELIGPAFRMLGKTESENAARGTLLNWRRAAGLGTLGAGAAATGMVAPTAMALAPLYATSIVGQTKPGARFLFGDYGWQKGLKGALESPSTGQTSLANMIRAMRDSSQYGFAMTPGE